jgi:hypothetical protein
MVKEFVNECEKLEGMTTAYPDICYPVVIPSPQRSHPEISPLHDIVNSMSSTFLHHQEPKTFSRILGLVL